MTNHFVYMIECINGTYYTGYTTDIARRYKEHQKGSNKCRYTRSFPPKALVLTLSFETQSDALKKEAEIKKMSRHEKTQFIKNHLAFLASANTSAAAANSVCVIGLR